MDKSYKIKSIRWDITDRCNLNCIHCFSSNSNLSDLNYEQIISIINKIKPLGLKEINLAGREPTLRKDLSKICNWCYNNNIIINLTTNGTLLTPNELEKLLNANVSMIVFSLDGTTAKTHDRIRGFGTFDRVLKIINHGVEYINKIKLSSKIGISYTLNKLNANELPDIINICDNNKIDFLAVNPISFHGSAFYHKSELYLPPDNIFKCWEQLCKRYQDYSSLFELYLSVFPMEARYLNAKYNLDLPVVYTGCSAEKTLYIDPEGKSLPCYMLPVMANKINELKQYIKYWSILEESYENALPLFQPFINFTRKYSQRNNKKCASCPDVNVCKRCPLIAISDPEAIVRCQTAYHKLETLSIFVNEKTNVKIKSHIKYKMDNNKLYLYIKKGDFFNDKVFDLAPLAQEIWSEIIKNSLLSSIKTNLNKKIKGMNELDLSKSLSDFIIYFWKEGIISIKNNEE